MRRNTIIVKAHLTETLIFHSFKKHLLHIFDGESNYNIARIKITTEHSLAFC